MFAIENSFALVTLFCHDYHADLQLDPEKMSQVDQKLILLTCKYTEMKNNT